MFINFVFRIRIIETSRFKAKLDKRTNIIYLDHVSKRSDIKAILKPLRYTHAFQPRQIDTRAPFVERGFELVVLNLSNDFMRQCL